MQALDETFEAIHGERIGITLFLLEIGRDDGSNVTYISNCNRDEMIAAVKEWLGRVEVGLVDDPLGPKASA